MNFNKLKNTLDSIIESYGTPGVDCIVYKEHREIFRYFSGVSDIENNKKINGNELYIIFSMTKMLTCTCALQLFEQGKFAMGDPVSKYLPEFEKMSITKEALDGENALAISSGKSEGESTSSSFDGYAKNPITVKDLFTMGAGLDYDLNASGIKEALASGKTSTREIVGAMSKTILGFEPGTRFRYSLCHDVLGALIEIWSGLSFGEYLKKNLTDPLEMNDTFFGVPKDEKRLSRMAQRYKFDSNGKPELLPLVCPYNISDDYQSGGAGLISSTSDYAIFLDALANGGIGKNGHRILSPSSVELMKANHLKGKQCEDFDKMRRGYGYGLGVRTHIDPERSGALSPVGEFGWDGAAGAFSMVDVKNKLSLTYFQSVHGWNVEIQNMLKNALYQSLSE